MTGIYMIKCLANGKKYIGKAKDLLSRERQHFSKLSVGNHPCIEMQNDYNKYGYENFVFEVLEQCDEDKLNHLEDYYILSNHTIECGYNSKRGDVISLTDENFEYSDVDNKENTWLEKLKDARDTHGYEPYKCLQCYVHELNMMGNVNYSFKDYLPYIKSKNTKFFIYVNKLSGINLEEISLDNVYKFYDKYFIYVKDAKVPKIYDDYRYEMFSVLKKDLIETIDMVVNSDMRYEKSLSLDTVINAHQDMCKKLLILDTDENYKYRKCVFFENNNFYDGDEDLTSSFVEYLCDDDTQRELMRLFIMAIERHMTLTINDVLNKDLSRYMDMIN